MQIICANNLCLQGGGAAVISGATSTMLVTVFLASARSYVVITLFYSLLLIVLCGAFNGLVVLPVLLGMLSSAKQRQAGRGINSAESKAGFDAKMPHAYGPDKGRTGAACHHGGNAQARVTGWNRLAGQQRSHPCWST